MRGKNPSITPQEHHIFLIHFSRIYLRGPSKGRCVVPMPFLNELLIQPNDTLVVAVSGGIDSMVLLHALVELKSSLGLTLILAHVNHHTRPETEDEALLVKQTATSYDLPFELLDYHHAGKSNFQQAARNARYDFFVKVATRYRAQKIVLAHQADDQAETILMRLVRGSVFSGYSGIHAETDFRGLKLIRPLLAVSRQEIIAYQEKNQIAYLEDSSNRHDHYTRNRYRHQILPLLAQENPLYLEKFTQFSAMISEASDSIRTQAKALHESLVHYHDDGAELSLSRIRPIDSAIKREIFTCIINRLSGDTVEVSFRQLTDLMRLETDPKPQVEIDIDQSLIAIKQYDQLVFYREKPQYPRYEHIVTDFQEIKLPGGMTFAVHQNISNSHGKHIELWYNDLDSIFPLTIRNRRPGDRIRFPYGSKKLKTFFIDKKVPQSERETIPLVFSRSGDLLWIPGYYRKRLAPGEKSLMLDYWKGTNHAGE